MNRTLVIAEAGVNHNGDIEQAFNLIRAAAESGADIVKFQTFQAKNIATRTAEKASYQKKSSGGCESQLSMLKKLEITSEEHLKLIKYCEECKIEFLSTAFDLDSIDLLSSLGLRYWKIPSGEITNLPYIRKLGSQKGSVILSTGMANIGEIEMALNALTESGKSREEITVLHCTTEYPAPLNEVNLRAIKTIGETFKISVGYSDHTDGIAVPIAAVAMGAIVIEKHLTLDKRMKGPDHLASLEPDQFSMMVQGIRDIEQALGDGIKRPTTSEIANLPIARKSIVASQAIKEGEVFSCKNITTKRPGTGISPMNWDSVIGRKATRPYRPDELIEW